MNAKFGTTVSLDLIMPKLVKVTSNQPVTSDDLEILRAESQLQDVSQSTLAAVRSAEQQVLNLTQLNPVARQALTQLAHFPALVALGESVEIGGVTQFYQLVNGEIRLTKKNRPGWPAHTHFLFFCE